MKIQTIKRFFPGAKIDAKTKTSNDILTGTIEYRGSKWQIKDGLMHTGKLTPEAIKEKKATALIDKKRDILDNDYYGALKSLPDGDPENKYFSSLNPFSSVSLGSDDFNKLVRDPARKSMDVLEIGADTGWGSANLAKKGCNVIAFDINDYHLTLKDFWEKQGCGYEGVVGDMNYMPFPDNSFDLVIASASIHHSQNLEKTASEIYRVLKANGRFVFLREPAIGKWSKKTFGEEEIASGISENIYSKKTWLDAFGKAGFRNIKMEMSYLDYLKLAKQVDMKSKVIFTLKAIKRSLLKNVSPLQNFTITDFNLIGKK